MNHPLRTNSAAFVILVSFGLLCLMAFPPATEALVKVTVAAPTYYPSPSSATAQSGSPISQVTNVNDLVTKFVSIGQIIEYLLVFAAVIFIVWNIVMYFIKGKEGETSRREAGMHILWGIVGLFLIFSIWGLVNILLQTFGTNTTPPNALPNANFLTTPNSTTGS